MAQEALLSQVRCSCKICFTPLYCVHVQGIVLLSVYSFNNHPLLVFQGLKVVLLGNKLQGQGHFPQSLHNREEWLNKSSPLMVLWRSCSLFHFPGNKLSSPLGFLQSPSFCFLPAQKWNKMHENQLDCHLQRGKCNVHVLSLYLQWSDCQFSPLAATNFLVN